VTQTAGAPAPVPARATPAPVAPARAGQPKGAVTRAGVEDTPRLLNRLQVLAVAALVAFGAVAAVLQVLSWQAQGRAADNTEQVVRVQQIQSELLRADALATNSYLAEGLESADARAEYDESIDTALRLIADAADAQSADRQVLADLNTVVSSYTTSVAQARDYNRQQFPIGIAYLKQAGRVLRGDALPITQALVDTNSERALDEMDGQSPIWLFWVGVAAVVVLVLVNRQIARRFHRRWNVGLVVAALVVAAVTIVVSTHAMFEQSGNDDLKAGAYQDAVDEASARTAANNAKAIESLGLIDRGSGTTVYEPQWDAQAAIVEAAASNQTLSFWNDYVDAHAQVRNLDDNATWDDAVEFATGDEPGSPTALLDAVDVSAAAIAKEQGEEAAAGFRSGGATSLMLIVLTGVGALLAAYAASRGIGTRRKEYA
jgi:hypothetical protein